MAKSKGKRKRDPLRIVDGRYVPPAEARDDSTELLPLEEYDHIIVSFSGGKDSVACVLHLLDLGVPRDCIELWHQAVDGEPGVAPRFFDWPCTESYCRAFAEALGLNILFQWKDGGFQGEMLRDNEPTRPTMIELLDGDADGAPPLGRAQLREWEQICTAVFDDLQAGRPRPPLRPYGSVNRAEFFAVATEAFFDQPVELATREPDLYRVLADFYRQDPGARV